jgi:hypothetical protein
MQATDSSPYICITADTHAGASLDTYGGYLDPKYRDDADVPEPEVRMMLGENAAKLYGFDLEALRPLASRANITPALVATRLDEIPADSQCLAFQRTRAEWRGNKRPMKGDHPPGGPEHDG